MKLRGILAAACACAVTAGLLCGCGLPVSLPDVSSDTPAVPTAEPSPLAAEQTYTCRFGMAYLPADWNPLTVQDVVGERALELLTTPLYGYDAGGDGVGFVLEPMAAAAEPTDVTAQYAGLYDGWDGSEGYAYRIELNQNLCWQDGTKVDADDYLYSLKALLDGSMANANAVSVYDEALIIRNAENYRYAGLTRWRDNTQSDGSRLYPREVWKQGDDGAYTGPDGQALRFCLNDACARLDGLSMAYLYSKGYFAECYTELLALADEDGRVPVTDKTLDILFDFTGSSDWDRESEEELAAYVFCAEECPDMDFDEVGLVRCGDYTLDVLLEQPLDAFSLMNALTQSILVYEPLYESCLADGVLYGSDADTTASCGPYRLLEYAFGGEMVFERSDGWFGYSDAYADEYGEFRRASDGAQCPQYPADEVRFVTAADVNAREALFLSGGLEEIPVGGEMLARYADSASLYRSAGETTFFAVLCSDRAALLARENVLNGGDEEDDPEDCRTAFRYNKTILAIPEFRQALSLAVDRVALCASLYPTGVPAVSLFSDAYVGELDMGAALNELRVVREDVCAAWGVTCGEDGDYATLDEAYASLCHGDLSRARRLVNTACDLAMDKGWMTQDSVVRLTLCAANGSGVDENWLLYLQTVLEELTNATDLEGRLEVETELLEQDATELVQSGDCDIFVGASVDGEALDPYAAFGAFCDAAFGEDGFRQYDAWNDWSYGKVALTADVQDAGVETDHAYSVFQWYKILNGNVKNLPDWSLGNAPQTVRVLALSAIQRAVLEDYTMLPLFSEGSATLLSSRVQYGLAQPVYGLGCGGLRYLSFSMNDGEWAAYCAAHPDAAAG